MDRREFHKALAALIGLTVFDLEKAEARVITKEVLATMSHEENGMVCPIIVLIQFERTLHNAKFPFTAMNPDDERYWYKWVISNYKSMRRWGIQYHDPILGRHVTSIRSFFDSSRYYKICTDERIPRGHLWNFNEWNEDVVDRLQEDVDWYRELMTDSLAPLGLDPSLERPKDGILMIYSNKDAGKFLKHEVLKTGVPQRETASRLIMV